MKTDTILLVAIAIMLALGLFGMYQWRPLVKFVRDKWIPAASPAIRSSQKTTGRSWIFGQA